MTVCMECGREMGEQATVCLTCGSPIEEVTDSSASLLDVSSHVADKIRTAASDRLPDSLPAVDSLPDFSSLEYPGLTKRWGRIQSDLEDRLADLKERSSNQMPGLLTFLHVDDLRQWLDAAYEGTQTHYDRAMDAAFIAKQRAGELGYSAGQHRLFDEGHTIWGSFERAQEAVPGDSELAEIAGWAEAYMKDLTTPSGMPIVNLNPAQYDQWAEAFSSVPGVDKRYLFDLLNFDAMQVVASQLGVVGVLFALNDDDLERLSELLGAMGINAIVAANPVLGMVTIATTAYAYWRHEKLEGKEVMKGGAIAGVSSIIFINLGLPVLVELVVVVVVGYQMRKRIFENEEFLRWLKSHLKDRSLDIGEVAAALPRDSQIGRKVTFPKAGQ